MTRFPVDRDALAVLQGRWELRHVQGERNEAVIARSKMDVRLEACERSRAASRRFAEPHDRQLAETASPIDHELEPSVHASRQSNAGIAPRERMACARLEGRQSRGGQLTAQRLVRRRIAKSRVRAVLVVRELVSGQRYGRRQSRRRSQLAKPDRSLGPSRGRSPRLRDPAARSAEREHGRPDRARKRWGASSRPWSRSVMLQRYPSVLESAGGRRGGRSCCARCGCSRACHTAQV
jgi:hypothetical protein